MIRPFIKFLYFQIIIIISHFRYGYEPCCMVYAAWSMQHGIWIISINLQCIYARVSSEKKNQSWHAMTRAQFSKNWFRTFYFFSEISGIGAPCVGFTLLFVGFFRLFAQFFTLKSRLSRLLSRFLKKYRRHVSQLAKLIQKKSRQKSKKLIQTKARQKIVDRSHWTS